MIAQLGVKNIIGCDIDGAVVPGSNLSILESNGLQITLIQTLKVEVYMM